MGRVTGVIKTNDPEVAKAALTTYTSAVEAEALTQAPNPTVLEWMEDSTPGTWEPPNLGISSLSVRGVVAG